MSKRIDIQEVYELQKSFLSYSNSVQTNLRGIEREIINFSRDNTFTGQAAGQAKRYFQEYHLINITAFINLFADLSRNLNQNLRAFHAEVDSHQRTLVREYDLEDIQEEIRDEFKKVKSYHNTIHSTLRNVTDIASVRVPSLDDVTSDKDQSVRHINQLKSDLNSFNRRKHTSKIEAVTRQLNNNLKQTKGISGNARLKLYNKLVKSGDLDQLKVYNKENALSKRHTSTVRALINMYRPDNPTVPFNIFTNGALNRYLIEMISGGQVRSDKNLAGLSEKLLGESTALSTVMQTIIQADSFDTALKMIKANKGNSILGAYSHVNSRTGSSSFRLTINREGLAALGVEADYRAISDFNYRLPKNGQSWSAADAIRAQQNQTILRPADQRSLFKTQFTNLGEKVIGRHPQMQFLGSGMKHVGSAGLKGASQGAVEGFTDFYTIFSKNQSKVAFTSKAVGNAGTLLSFYSNYDEARNKDGLSVGESIGRASLDTTIDTVVAGAVQKGITAGMTAAIPIPGVGTAVGAVIGIGAVWALNHDWGGNGKTAMDVVKGWFR
ncbi:T7SS effector LXG polymorphic toxin [Amphibacillus cookii]|uniref:T7SS effector LXG polymorphic toxin n=1 Tax=Amphibacillus cookii TaxID=767787 RepID=UPI00195EC0E2|nr:T7SS effector LXG polymorphic toxin [Amphibacillus cookii]MBM7541141.1 uncharacterized protein YukE [Amphibacillus cookii]